MNKKRESCWKVTYKHLERSCTIKYSFWRLIRSPACYRFEIWTLTSVYINRHMHKTAWFHSILCITWSGRSTNVSTQDKLCTERTAVLITKWCKFLCFSYINWANYLCTQIMSRWLNWQWSRGWQQMLEWLQE